MGTFMKNEKCLVVGASGTVGSELVKILKAKGYSVRSATSKPAQSPDDAQINLATGEGMSAAFEGIERAFFLCPLGYADHYTILSPLIKEAKRRGLKKVVLLTGMSANEDETSGMRRAEVELEKSGLTYNIIRPNWFLQNFHTFFIQGIKEQGAILLPAGNAKVGFIDAKDISAVAAELLTSDKFNNKGFDITGPQALDHDEVAKEISAVSGKNIVYQEIQPEDMRKGLLGAGMPADVTEFFLTILAFLKAGRNSLTTNSVKEILGREPRSIKDYVQENKQAFV
jgi:uncharacterized protein YbjT (DUF2867 family)